MISVPDDLDLPRTCRDDTKTSKLFSVDSQNGGLAKIN